MNDRFRTFMFNEYILYTYIPKLIGIGKISYFHCFRIYSECVSFLSISKGNFVKELPEKLKYFQQIVTCNINIIYCYYLYFLVSVTRIQPSNSI